jgi:osmotically-inducible protein OsmY
VDDLQAWLGENCLAVIRTDLEAPARLPRDVETLRERTSLPLFAVLSEGSSTAQVRRCYAAGASGVFEWPREADLLDRYLAEVLSLRLIRGAAEKPETALARAVRARLKQLPGLVEVPRLEVRRGIVRASGTVDSLPVKRDVEECIAAVPGVSGVDTGALHVVPDPVPDQEIRRTCRRLLRASDGIDERAVSISVDGGRLILRGSARDRRELGRLQALAANIRGVRDVAVEVVASKRHKELDRRAASRLTRIVEDVFPGQRVALSFFGGTAVLTGEVRTLRVKRAIEGFLDGEPRVERVVNKLEVQP